MLGADKSLRVVGIQSGKREKSSDASRVRELEDKFGKKASENIIEMSKIKLKRKLLGD